MTASNKAVVYVSLKEGVLDPQGVTIQKALGQMGYSDILSVRAGKFFELEFNAAAKDIDNQIQKVCSDLLANPVIEDFKVEKV